MINLTAAREQVSQHLNRLELKMNSAGSALPGYRDRPMRQLVITDIQEHDFGWVFFYNSKEFVESGKIMHKLAGNAPLIVDRNDGHIYVTGTARPLTDYIDDFRNGKKHLAAIE